MGQLLMEEKKLDYRKFMNIATKWGIKNLNSYAKENFGDKFYINEAALNKNIMIELFVEDEQLNDYCDPEQLGENETMYMIEEILVYEKIIKDKDELTGEELSWFCEDFIGAGGIRISPLSNLEGCDLNE